ncbi:MAG: epoxyqueuosine reductase [Candidatus Omnitrophica bacterium]|nr:epoxyqueuosine reductase [Candidatus Omnitrophota bacterium]
MDPRDFSDNRKNYDLLKERALSCGLAFFGVAATAQIPSEYLLIETDLIKQFPYAISAGYRLSKAVLQTIDTAPSLLYSMHYRRVNTLLDHTALMLATVIQQSGFEALPIPASQVVDWTAEKGTVSHRHVAFQAGLGWIGRNNLLVNPNCGSQLRLVSILTDFPLEVNQPSIQEDCGDCLDCVRACPVEAIKRERKDFDFAACSAKLNEFSRIRGIGHKICGVCVKACWGQASLRRHLSQE